MFGIFKKKATPPTIELSDDVLDLIHGGRPPSALDAPMSADPQVHEFDTRDAVVAVVGRGDGRGRWGWG